MADTNVIQQQVVSCAGAATRQWYAWLNTMPPKPDDFHVTGEVQVANPGIEALLLKREPQGINPSILLLDLHLVQKPGIWPAKVSWAQARYDEVPAAGSYTEVNVFCESKAIARMDVQIVS
jgi:hypothetical protein